MDHSQYPQTVKTVSLANAHQRASTAKESLTNVVDKTVCSVEVTSPLSPATLGFA